MFSNRPLNFAKSRKANKAGIGVGSINKSLFESLRIGNINGYVWTVNNQKIISKVKKYCVEGIFI